MTKREAILDAATELFARKGYKGTAASEIADQADVAQGTVFHHFKSKENLLVSICDQLVQDYLEGMQKAAEGPGTGWDALERILLFNLSFKEERCDAITVAFRETWDLSRAQDEINRHFNQLVSRIIELKKECIAKGIEDGSIRSVPVLETALMIHYLLVGKFHIETEGLLSVPVTDDELIAFCRRSLASGGSIGVSGGKSSGG